MTILPHSRRILGVVFALAIASVCAGGAAAASPAVHLANEQSAVTTLTGPQFYSGGNVEVAGVIDGDVYVAGQNVTISADVTGDVIAAAQTITVTGTIDGDVRLAAQTISISGSITQSGTVAAADVTVSDTASFGKDVVGTADTVNVGGRIERDLLLSVNHLAIGGSVNGNVAYTSDNPAVITDSAVGGTVVRTPDAQPQSVEVTPWAAFIAWLVWLLYSLVALSLITLVAGLLVPRLTKRVTDQLFPSPWKALLVGFLASIVVPIALFFLFLTVIGAPLALVGAVVWVALILASFVIGANYLGRLVFGRFPHPMVKLVLGGAILIVALHIPWINVLVWITMVSFGVGAQLVHFSSTRPWRTASEASNTATAPQAPSPRTEVSP